MTHPSLSADMSFSLQEVDAMVAVMSGAVQRVPANAVGVLELLDGLRGRFITTAIDIRQRAGLPVD